MMIKDDTQRLIVSWSYYRVAAWVIDTPGMRELGMWDNSTGIEQAFAEIEEIAANCRFSDCTHSGEPGCAIRKALENGSLPLERLAVISKIKSGKCLRRGF